MKNIDQIKVDYAQTGINFVEQFNEENVSTGWAKHWDNESRISIIIPVDLALRMKEDRTTQVLDRDVKTYPKAFLELPANATPAQIEEREASAYRLITLFQPRNIIASF